MVGPGVITKRVLRDTTYLPSGSPPETFTAGRIAHMSEQFRAMKAAGLKVGVPLMHPKPGDPLFTPVPVQRAEGKDFAPGPNHAGWLADVRAESDGKATWMVWDIELAKGIDPDKLNFFSPAIAKEFRDGAGRKWNDVIVHAAAVYHPIAYDQPDGFVPGASDVTPMGVVFFSSESGAPNMAGKDDKGKGGEGVGTPDIKAAIEVLGQIGLDIPADTPMLGLLAAIEASIGKLKSPAVAGDDKPKDAPAGDAPPPPMPAMMSAQIGQLNGRLAALEADNARLRQQEFDGQQARRKARIESLRKSQILAPGRADQLLAGINTVVMSAAVGSPTLIAADAELDTLERLNPGAVFGPSLMSATAGYQQGGGANGKPPVSAVDVMLGKAEFPKS